MVSLLRNKVAIVTGASSGFGEAISIKFASQGAKVVLCGRDRSRLNYVYDKVVKVSGGHEDMFLAVEGDLNEHAVRKEIIDKIIDTFGRLDILVANAGVTSSKQALLYCSEETYDDIMDTNLKSTFFLIKQAVKHLEKSKGNIINISSIASSVMFSGALVYALSKVALDYLTRSLAFDLGPKGIRVNSVNPSYIPTRILRNNGESLNPVISTIAMVERSKQVLHLNDRVLTLEDITEAVTFLASDAAGFITGEILKLDGGRNLAGPASKQYAKL